MSLFVIAQIVSVITIITTVLALFQKEKFKTMILFTISNLSMMATYSLLGRWLSLILVGIASVRTFIYYLYAVKNLKPNYIVMVAFEVVLVIVSILLWEDYLDLLMLINLCMLTYMTWQDNMKLIRAGYVVSALLLITYDILVKAYVGMISEVILLVSSAISIIRYDIKGRIDDIVTYFYQTIAPFHKTRVENRGEYVTVISESVSDVFNNFVYIKNPLEYKKYLDEAKKIMFENDKKPAIYFQSKNNENIQFIIETSRENILLFRDVWMKLRDGYNTIKKKTPLISNVICKEVDEKYKDDIIYLFKEGFIRSQGGAVYKFDEEYINNYQEFLTDENLKKYNVSPYLAFYEEKPIALLFVYRNCTNAFLCQITTLEKYRRLGVATLLINRVVDIERKKGIGQFYLVTEKYTYLESFYLKNNFEEISQGVCIQIKDNIDNTSLDKKDDDLS